MAEHYYWLKTKLAQVTVNGEPVPFELVKKDPSAFPIHTEGAASDGSVAVIRFTALAEDTQKIVFTVKE